MKPQVPLQTAFTGFDRLWLSRTVLASDIVVSMPEGENASLGWRNSEHEEPVRCCAGCCLWLAEEPAALQRD